MSSATLPADVSVVDVVLPHEVSAVADARRRLAAYLKRYRAADAACDDAQLVLSELLSNAIRYAPPLPGGEVRAAWWIDKAGIHVEVTDGRGDTEPQRIGDTHPESIGGRGLAIVDILTSSWDVRSGAHHRTVHAVVPS
ncbi:ATP-binding protein [Kribbella sandramycini]|uniref:ATP-binding protein n=1 Tax=Kribbella sandramycini TaxID=60450 RepID=A0A7Y4L203_9ACTN|nr:ATP-binding protein [Kribbella sandramycini]MBB6565734.1 anti-sigma regulatory factor (Ser/Thr protein kinase) [Kribbella sandramycini]NOL41996.1 ATP-binding protein [Kribbella sandramycini]